MAPNRSDDGLFDAYANLIRLILFVLYALYIVIGIILIIVGVTMAGKGLTGGVALSLILSGVSMLFIGAGCLVCCFFKLWLVMIVLQVINFALFVFLITTGIIGVFVGSGYSDPIGDAFEEYFHEIRVADGAAEDLGFCFLLAEENDLNRLDKGQDWAFCREAYLLSNPSCSITKLEELINAGEGTPDLPSGESGDISMWGDLFVHYGNCTSLEQVLESENDAETTTDEDGNEIVTLLSNIPSAFQEYSAMDPCQVDFVTSTLSCDSCNEECKNNAASITKNNMTPIAVTMFLFWCFFVVTAAVNNHIVDYAPPSEDEDADDEDEDEDGKGDRWIDHVPFHAKLLCWIFDGICILFGLILIIAGFIAFAKVRTEEGCPMKKVGKDCPSEVFIVVVLIGVGVMTTGALVVISTFLSFRYVIMVANLVFIGLSLILLIATIMLGLATGVLSTSVTALDAQYKESRDEIRKVCDDDECTLFCAEECNQMSMCENQFFDVPCDGWEGLEKPTGGFVPDDPVELAQVQKVEADNNVMCQDCDSFNTPVKCLPQRLCPSDYDDYHDDYLLQFHEFYWGSESTTYAQLIDDADALKVIFPEVCTYNADFQYEESVFSDTNPDRFVLTGFEYLEGQDSITCQDYATNGFCDMAGASWNGASWDNVEGSGWDSTWGSIDDFVGSVLVSAGVNELQTPREACCECGAMHCGCPENDPEYKVFTYQEVFNVDYDAACEWMTVCQYDCEVCEGDEFDIRCSEVLATDPNVACGDSYEASQNNIATCSVQGGHIFTNQAGGVQAPDGTYCDDNCEICGLGADMSTVIDSDTSTAEYYTSAEDCIRCADNDGDGLPDLLMNVLDYTVGTGECAESSWDYQADLPVPEQCQCTYKWTGCKQYPGPRVGYKDMSADDCKAEVKAKVEDYMKTIGVVAIIICCIFVGIMFLTAIAIDIWRDEEPDDEVEVETKTYVDGVLVDQSVEMQ